MTTVAKTISRAADDLASRLHDASDKIIELKDDAQRSIGSGVKTVGSTIKQHPFAAIAIGVAVGYLGARLLHRG